jgi:tRNA A58 N-methylase Trm61
VTFGIVDRIGVAADARCLEVGAGAGSVARWLAEHCHAGHVVATDIDTTHLRDAAPGIDVRTHDVVNDESPMSRSTLCTRVRC